MSYKVETMFKKTDSRGEEKIFVSLAILDDLGRYNYGVWMHPDDYDALKLEMGEKNFDAWTRYGEFRFLNPDSKSLAAFCEEILPAARIFQQNNIAEEKISQAERLTKASNPGVIDPVQLATIKEELRVEILNELKIG